MMISYVRSDYDSASQWLEALRQDDAWLSQLQQLQNAAPDELSKHHQMASNRIEEGAARDFWYFYKHDVGKVVDELWEANELTLPKLKTQAIWMLTVEWLEREQKCVINNRKEIVAKLNPIFYNDEAEASKFLSEIQGMKAKQITDKVNKLVRARIISEMSRKRELWAVLHDYGLYDKSESNWNSQVD
jgi:hypothetical protein